MNRLEPLTTPLRGRILIEASAGTGKTYNLTALYLRLLLGFGDTAFPNGVAPEQILVLTFTKAATQELKERIRLKLEQLCAHLQGAPCDDAWIVQLVAHMEDKPLYLKRCLLAVKQMDKAAIYTIHGFCQRVLKRFAFATGQAFDLDLETDEWQLKQQALQDFWRKFVQPLDKQSAQQLEHEGFRVLADLAKALSNYQPADQAAPASGHLAVLLQQHEVQKQEKKQQLIAQLTAHYSELLQWFDEQFANKILSKSSFNKNSFAALEAFVAGSDESIAKLKNFTPQHIIDKSKTSESLIIPPVLSQLADYLQLCHQGLKPTITAMADAFVKQHIEQQLQAQGKMTYDSMVSALAKALAQQNHNQLSEQLSQAYPCLLVDEFQDTDHQQFAIFARIYQNLAPENYVFLMIGDPKQAIYSFRGAEIQAYLDAKRQLDTSHHYTLNVNYRSSAAMVEACNTLFLQSPLGDTLFNQADITFVPIIAADNSEQKRALQGLYWANIESEKALSAEQARHSLADYFARQVWVLLYEQAFAPDDICLLVRSASQAQQLKQTLTRYGIDSVYLSEKDSVYQQPEAAQLVHILLAVSQPQNSALLRNALATQLLNYSWQEQWHYQQDQHWQSLMRQFGQWKKTWQNSGPLVMLHQLAQQCELAQRQKSPRSLTNLFHLAELLQQASRQLDSVEGQIDYLQKAIMGDVKGDADEQLIRLESERNLVKIMTLHKSKGLEFPIVLLPFACLANRHWQENIDEEMRLLYVGITRAKYACYLPLLNNQSASSQYGLNTSALGRLVFAEQTVDNDAIQQRLAALCAHPFIQLMSEPQVSAMHSQTAQNRLPVRYATEARAVPPWQSTSYSQISYMLHQGRYDKRELWTEKPLDEAYQEVATSAQQASFYTLQGSAALGSLVHQLLQDSQAFQFADAAIELAVDKHCANGPWQEQRPLLVDWLKQIVQTPLPLGDQRIQLNALSAKASLAESQFCMNFDNVDNQAISHYALQLVGEGARDVKQAMRYNGVINGAIDLIVCLDGKYYVVDYKSNFLGASAEDYHQQAMHEAVLEHRYDVQALVYQQALHRLLQSRLSDYHIDKHLGGCAFFFIRGIENASAGIYFIAPDRAVIEKTEQLFGLRA